MRRLTVLDGDPALALPDLRPPTLDLENLDQPLRCCWLQPEHIQLVVLSRSEAPLYRTVEPRRDGNGLTCTCPRGLRWCEHKREWHRLKAFDRT